MATCNAEGSNLTLGVCAATSCSSGYYLNSGVCKPQVCSPNSTGTKACAVPNGSGTQLTFCNTNGSNLALGACTANSCNSGYYLNNGVCTLQVCAPNSTGSKACAVPNGSGTQITFCNSNGSNLVLGACNAFWCNSGYYLNSGVCKPHVCPPNAKGTKACSVLNGSGIQTTTCNANGSNLALGACTANSCARGYYLNKGVCQLQVCTPNSKGTTSCTVPNGSGTQTTTCNANGSNLALGACIATRCNKGYYFNSMTKKCINWRR